MWLVVLCKARGSAHIHTRTHTTHVLYRSYQYKLSELLTRTTQLLQLPTYHTQLCVEFPSLQSRYPLSSSSHTNTNTTNTIPPPPDFRSALSSALRGDLTELECVCSVPNSVRVLRFDAKKQVWTAPTQPKGEVRCHTNTHTHTHHMYSPQVLYTHGCTHANSHTHTHTHTHTHARTPITQTPAPPPK